MRHNEGESIGYFFDPNSNGIGFIRLALAIAVIIQHCFALNNLADPLTKFETSNLGAIGVNGFFILSGFLITNSWLNSKSFINFTLRRVLRIFPAFWICLIITSVFFAPLIALINKISLDFGFIIEASSYVYQNFFLMIFKPDIANLTIGNTEHSFNGSLWTLSWEFGFYILLALAGTCGLLTRRKLLFALAIICYSFVYLLSDCKCTIFFKLYTSERVAILPVMFGLGILAALYIHKIPNNVYLFTACLLLWIADLKYNSYLPLYPFFFAYILLWLIVNLPIKSFEKYGDYSYGLYIYHFPVIQIMLLVFNFNISPWLLSLIIIIPTGFMAYLSWNIIEKPALQLKKYLPK